MRVAVLFAFLLAVAGCGGQEETTQPKTTQPAATTQPTTEQTTTAAAASAVSGTTLDGERISLDDFRGKPVFVNVWSSW